MDILPTISWGGGPHEVRWRGSFQAAVDDVNEHPFEIGPHFFGGNTEGLHAFFAYPLITPVIAPDRGFKVVR